MSALDDDSPWESATELVQVESSDEPTQSTVRMGVQSLGPWYLGQRIGLCDEAGDYYEGELTHITYERAWSSKVRINLYLVDKKATIHLFDIPPDTTVEFK